jgi:hypothetical protein
MSTKPDLPALVSRSLHTLLRETLFRADDKAAYLLNSGEPGLVETLNEISAKTASTPPGPGRKPIVSHTNHVLFGLDLADRAIGGDPKAYENADWDEAWKLEQVNDQEWEDLLAKLDATAQRVLEGGPQIENWNEIMLTGMFGVAAHTAYHLGAIRQMLRSIGGASSLVTRRQAHSRAMPPSGGVARMPGRKVER